MVLDARELMAANRKRDRKYAYCRIAIIRMVTKINYSFLKGTGWGTDSISGLPGVN